MTGRSSIVSNGNEKNDTNNQATTHNSTDSQAQFNIHTEMDSYTDLCYDIDNSPCWLMSAFLYIVIVVNFYMFTKLALASN